MDLAFTWSRMVDADGGLACGNGPFAASVGAGGEQPESRYGVLLPVGGSRR